MLSGVFIPEELDRVGDEESGDTTMVDADTLRGLCEHTPKICMFH